MLLGKGADPDIRDDRGYTPFITAAYDGRVDIMAMLLEKGADSTSRTKRGHTALWAAAFESHVQAAQFLLKQGRNGDSIDEEGNTPLHAWILGKVHDLQRASPNASPQPGFAGVKEHKKTDEEFLATGRALLEAGANLQAKNAFGHTPLHLASAYLDPDAIRLLVSSGSDVNARNNSGNTPLHLVAYESGNVESAQFLIVNGAKIEARNNHDTQAQQLTPLLAAALVGHADLVKQLIDVGADPRAAGMIGQTALHQAAWKGHLHVAEILLQSDVDVNARDDNGVTPLSIAEYFDHSSMASFLRSKGASK